MIPCSVVDSFNVGDDVVDAYLILRGRVCDLTKRQIEVDYRVDKKDIKRLNLKGVNPTIMTGTYTPSGLLLSFCAWERPFPIRTLYLVDRFNRITVSMLAIQKLLKTL
jgi:hypothetical protein